MILVNCHVLFLKRFIQCNVEKYAIEYGKTVDWFKKTIDGVWENLKSLEEEDEDTEDDDEESSCEEWLINSIRNDYVIESNYVTFITQLSLPKP